MWAMNVCVTQKHIKTEQERYEVRSRDENEKCEREEEKSRKEEDWVENL